MLCFTIQLKSWHFLFPSGNRKREKVVLILFRIKEHIGVLSFERIPANPEQHKVRERNSGKMYDQCPSSVEVLFSQGS
jgi:hypothetical protein